MDWLRTRSPRWYRFAYALHHRLKGSPARERPTRLGELSFRSGRCTIMKRIISDDVDRSLALRDVEFVVVMRREVVSELKSLNRSAYWVVAKISTLQKKADLTLLGDALAVSAS